MINENFMKKNNFLVPFVLVLIVFSSCDINSEWDDHYTTEAGDLNKARIVEELGKIQTVSQFTNAVKNSTVLDSILEYNQLFTIFAPTNDAFDAIDPTISSDKYFLERLLEYHVMPRKLISNDIESQSYKTITGKYLSITQNGKDIKIDGKANLIESDYISQNGVIHVVDKALNPTDNLFEYITMRNPMAGLQQYFDDFIIDYYDEENSPILGVDEQGDPIIDSVFISFNPLLTDTSNNIGGYFDIRNEDKYYSCLLPLNMAAAIQQMNKSSFLNNEISPGIWARPLFEETVIPENLSEEAYVEEINTRSNAGLVFDLANSLESLSVNEVELSNARVFTIDEINYKPEWLIDSMTTDYIYILGTIKQSDSTLKVEENQNSIIISFTDTTQEEYYTEQYGKWIEFTIEDKFYPVDYEIHVNGRKANSGTFTIDVNGQSIGSYNFYDDGTSDVKMYRNVGEMKLSTISNQISIRFIFASTHGGEYKKEQLLWIESIKFKPILN